MSIEEIRESDKMFLSAADIAPIMGCDPHAIRLQAQKDPEKLGFNVVVVGTRVRIPRKPFLDFIGGKA